jgi:hypothetical protein
VQAGQRQRVFGQRLADRGIEPHPTLPLLCGTKAIDGLVSSGSAKFFT